MNIIKNKKTAWPKRVTWSVKDVQSVRPDLSEEDAGNVLLLVREEHDANVGINWNFIEFIASNLFPEK